MIKYILCIAALAAPMQTFAQQISIPNDQYHYYGPNSTWGGYLQIGGNGRVTNGASVTATNGNLHLDSKPGFGTYINHYSLANTYMNTQGGNVGIGTDVPLTKLDVTGNLTIRNTQNVTGGGSSIHFTSFGNDNQGPMIKTSLEYAAGAISRSKLILSSYWLGYKDELTLVDGRVGIGTQNPTETLSVNGKIRSKEVKVEAANWPDYVFEDSYKSTSLSELESYIKTNKHLPEILSAKEVEENGISLGEMNAKLLKKIEEMTMYMIEQQKDIKELRSELNTIKLNK